MGDWTSDEPGVRRKITVQDLPQPSSNILAINRARVVDRPANAQPRVPPGFKVELYASGFRDPRFLLPAPNGDIFVVESRANRIKALRDSKGSGKPDVVETFVEHGLNKPFGIAFYPPGNDPHYLYVANTDGLIRFPIVMAISKRADQRNNWLLIFPRAGCCGAVDTGHVTSCSRRMAKRCTYRSVHARMFPIRPRKKIALASSSLIPMAPGKGFTRGAFATLSGSRFVLARTNSG